MRPVHRHGERHPRLRGLPLGSLLALDTGAVPLASFWEITDQLAREGSQASGQRHQKG